ncbi:MAG: diphthamide synthesis protein [Candidatus Nanoarchaeia archaeon]
MKTIFIEVEANKSVIEGLEKVLPDISYKKIGLLTTVQFARQLPKIKKFLSDKSFTVFLGKPTGSALLEGQVLGCDVSSALAIERKIEAFLYIGTGEFHPFGLLMKSSKPILVFDPFTGQLTLLDEGKRKNLLKKHILELERFKSAKVVGILVSTKPGQYELQMSAVKLKEKLEKLGKKAYLFICDIITNTMLLDFSHIEAWVNTACPRLVDDYFEKPVVNALDLECLYIPKPFK